MFQLRPLAFLLVLILLATPGLSTKWCGQVFDGPERGVDIDFQDDTRVISAHWRGFEDSTPTQATTASSVRYSWAVVADDHAILKNFERRCARSVDNYDDVEWTESGGDAFFTSESRLAPGTTYHVLVRAADKDGSYIVSKSDGVTVRGAAGKATRVPNPSCYIDQVNTCRAQTAGPQAILQAQFGSAVFFIPGDDTSGHSPLSAAYINGIVFGSIGAGLVLLALIIVVIVLVRVLGGGGDRFASSASTAAKSPEEEGRGGGF